MLNSAGAFSLLPPTIKAQKPLAKKNLEPLYRTPQGKDKTCPRGALQVELY